MSESKIILPDNIKNYVEIEGSDDFPINRYLVTRNQEEIIDDILRMKKRTKELQNMGIPYLNTTILYGPTGTGKTTFGRYLAYYTKQDFAYINFAKMIDGVFGNTARKLSDIFEFMSEVPCVFMLDELDCIATKRGNEAAATGGELTRITITLMQELDKYRRKKCESIIMAATNRYDMLDPALLNRFSLKKEIGPMNNEDKEKYVNLFLRDVKIEYDQDNIEDYCARNFITSQREVEADIIRCIARWIDEKEQDENAKFILSHILE